MGAPCHAFFFVQEFDHLLILTSLFVTGAADSNQRPVEQRNWPPTATGNLITNSNRCCTHALVIVSHALVSFSGQAGC